MATTTAPAPTTTVDLRDLDATLAVLTKGLKKSRNCLVTRYGNELLVYFYNTAIAKVVGGQLFLFNGGFETVVTKDRLNKVLEVLGSPIRVYSQNYDWHLSPQGTRFQEGVQVA
jgi:hypothetical protein